MSDKPEVLTGAAYDVLWGLFANGPSEDGDVASKAGRDQLVRLNMADRYNGWNWLTYDGILAGLDRGFGERKGKWQRDRARKARRP